MVQAFIDFAGWFVPPLGAYAVALFLMRFAIRHRVINHLRYPLHLGLMLGSVLLMFILKPMDMTGMAARVLRMLLYLDLIYLALRLAETVFLDKILRKQDLRIPRFFRDIARVLVLVLAVTILLKLLFGVEPGALLVTSTVLSAVIGLALQDVLANIFAGASLQMERPFAVGQWIRLGEREGRVTEMSWRSTKIRTRDNETVIIPNTTVSQADILNYHQPDVMHRVNLEIGTSYNDPPEQVKRSLLKLLQETEGVVSDPSPEIHVRGYADFSINYVMRFWIEDYEQRLRIEDRVQTKIWYRFRRDNIHIPFPIRNITMERLEHQEEAAEAKRRERLEEIAVYMREIDILAPFTEEKRRYLAETSRWHLFAKGEELVHEGDIESAFYIILSGKVGVHTLVKNRLTKIGSFETGFFFGEVALLTGKARTASVIAEEETEALIVDSKNFAPLMKENPEVAVTLSEILHKRSKELQDAKEEATTRFNRKKAAMEEPAGRLLHNIQRFFNL